MIHRRRFLKTLIGLSTLPFELTVTPKASFASAQASAKTAGFRMPLESQPHERTLMQWPSRADIYGSQRALDAVRSSIALIARSIAGFEPVVVLAHPKQMEAAAKLLGAGVELWPMAVEDLWCRDSGPTFVVSDSGAVAISDLGFNGWGNKQQHVEDGLIAKRVADRLGLIVYANGLVGEGGGVEVDGEGSVIAHESCWINRNRNKGSKAEIEHLMLDALGAERILWAPGVKGADITDYHIDALARFTKPGQVVIQIGKTIDSSDPWSVAAFETYEALKAARDAQGRKLETIVIPSRSAYARDRAISYRAT